MGRPKFFLDVGGIPLFERVLSALREIFADILVVANHPEWFRPYNVRIVRDMPPNRGVLGGLYTGLMHMTGDFGFCVAADMPFLSVDLIRYMTEKHDQGDVIIPRTPDGLQPLHAIYSRTCLEPIGDLLESGGLKIIDFFHSVTVVFISEAEIRRYDPLLLSFWNVNTEEDLQHTEEMLTNPPRRRSR